MRVSGDIRARRKRQAASGSGDTLLESLGAGERLDFAEALYELHHEDTALAEDFFEAREVYMRWLLEQHEVATANARRKLPVFHFADDSPFREPIELAVAMDAYINYSRGRTSRQKLEQWMICEGLEADFQLWCKRQELAAHREAVVGASERRQRADYDSLMNSYGLFGGTQ